MASELGSMVVYAMPALLDRLCEASHVCDVAHWLVISFSYACGNRLVRSLDIERKPCASESNTKVAGHTSSSANRLLDKVCCSRALLAN
jgi:hypothetical protein